LLMHFSRELLFHKQTFCFARPAPGGAAI